MAHLARVHESFSTFITARLPPRAIDVAGGTRSRDVGKAYWRTLYVMWVGEHSQAITNDEERRMFLRYWNNEATVPAFSDRCPEDSNQQILAPAQHAPRG